MKLNLQYFDIMEKTVYIYALVGGESDIRYIGQTVNLKNRLSEHKSLKCKKQEAKKRWVQELKNKNETLSMFVLEECSYLEADFLEKYYISLYKSWGFDLFNEQDGGRKGFKNSVRLKKIAKDSLNNYRKTHSSYMKGKKHSKESILKMSVSRIEKEGSIIQLDLEGNFIKEWFLGYKKIGEELGVNGSGILDCLNGKCRKAYGFIWIRKGDYSDEEIKRMVEMQKSIRRRKNKSPILQFSSKGEFIKEWELRKDLFCCFKSLSPITYCLNHRRHSAGGFIWIYKDEYTPELLKSKVEFLEKY